MRKISLISGVVLALFLSVCSLKAFADDWDRGWEQENGEIETSASGDTASVGASTNNHTGGSSNQAGGAYVPPSTDYVAYDPGVVYAPETPVKPTKLCRWVNPGEVDPMKPGKAFRICSDPADPEPAAEDSSDSAPAGPNPRVVAANAVASLRVPAPDLRFNPDPANNEWDAWAIGLPLWVDFDVPAAQNTSVTNQGINVQLSAERGQIHLDWGDGSKSVCTTWGGYGPTTDLRRATPPCGHTYTNPGEYTVTATAAWTVNWSALGQSGTLALTSTKNKAVSVKEFQAVVNG